MIWNIFIAVVQIEYNSLKDFYDNQVIQNFNSLIFIVDWTNELNDLKYSMIFHIYRLTKKFYDNSAYKYNVNNPKISVV
jgi:hypothetical protein